MISMYSKPKKLVMMMYSKSIIKQFCYLYFYIIYLQAKCERYWPLGGKQMTFGNLVLTLITEKERAAYITREIAVEDKKVMYTGLVCNIVAFNK